jgi:hypothetical protein
MEKEDLYLSVHLTQSNRTVVLEGDGFSVWIYVLNEQQEGVDFSGILCSLGKLSANEEEIQRFISEGNQPPLLAEYASEEAVINDLDPEDIRIEELDDDLIMVYIEDEAYAQIQPLEKLVFTKALSQSSPYGEPFVHNYDPDEEGIEDED